MRSTDDSSTTFSSMFPTFLKTRAAGYPPSDLTDPGVAKNRDYLIEQTQRLHAESSQSHHPDTAFDTYNACRAASLASVKLLLIKTRGQCNQLTKESIHFTIRAYRDCVAALAARQKALLDQKPAWPDPSDGVGASRVRGDKYAENHRIASRDLAVIDSFLRAAEAGQSLSRGMKEVLIAPRGDAILEFANEEAPLDQPVLRFRVHSHILSETSPLFRRMFQDHDQGKGTEPPRLKYEDEDDEDEILSPLLLPPQPTSTLIAGTLIRVYQMPHLEHDEHGSLSLLLHAAHMHTDVLPHKIAFPALVALAKTCLRYSCTRPVEVPLDYQWWPQHIERALTDEMPDGLVLISYAFGMRGLFTRMTKTVVLNAKNERRDILDKEDWPPKLRERLSQICRAKRAQVCGVVQGAVGEFLRPPPASPNAAGRGTTFGQSWGIDDATTRRGSASSDGDSSGAESDTSRPPSTAISTSTTVVPSTPPAPPLHVLPGPFTIRAPSRCPKGSHWCDATNLGWLMLVLNELNLLTGITSPALAPTDPAAPPLPARSLAELVSALRAVPSPPYPVHAAQRAGGVCDPAPPLRQAISDLYNSVAGLTLHEISEGKGLHGWGLSRGKRRMRQAVYEVWGASEGSLRGSKEVDAKGLDVVEGGVDPGHEKLCLSMLRSAEKEADMRALARVNKAFWETFCKYEKELLGKGKRGEQKVLILGQDGDGDVENEVDEVCPPTSSPTVPGHHTRSESMTVAEAEAILWPGGHNLPPQTAPTLAAVPVSTNSVGIPSTEGCREKFRTQDVLFVDQKTLAIIDGKELRAERDQRIGLVSPRGQG